MLHSQFFSVVSVYKFLCPRNALSKLCVLIIYLATNVVWAVIYLRETDVSNEMILYIYFPGQFICGNKKCAENEGLRSWEVNFAYMEHGEKKNALVKLRKL